MNVDAFSCQDLCIAKMLSQRISAKVFFCFKVLSIKRAGYSFVRLNLYRALSDLTSKAEFIGKILMRISSLDRS